MPLFVAQSDIVIVEEPNVPSSEVVELYGAAGVHRATDDLARIERMLKNSNIVITVRHAGMLVGFGRAITDNAFCCYLADLAVHRDYQRNGIGKAIVDALKLKLNDDISIMLLANPEAMDFNPPIGFQKVGNCWIMPRTH
jgi:ribosomal protein S18 acetylase RimI-like enzyme